MKNMKTRLILFILLFISGFAIAGCKQQNQYRPDAKIVAAFNNKYPQADKVEWEQKQGYYVAEFREDGIEHEAWFDGTGKWVMTESNLRYSSLPQAIREQFEKSVYSTWKKDDIDKIRGLGLGADDYITKPFSPSEMVARVKAHLSRYERLIGSGTPANDIIEIRGLKIDKTARRVYVNGEEKNFTTKEFDLLAFLAQNPNHVFTKEELFSKIWDMESIGDIATVTVHIKKIREKIEMNTAKPQYIETIWGVGYRFKV